MTDNPIHDFLSEKAEARRKQSPEGSWFVWDLDGTLCDVSWRERYIRNGAPDFVSGQSKWDAFHAGIPEDLPHEDMRTMFWMLTDVGRLLGGARDCRPKIAICTGRPEKWRGQTETWLKEYSIEYDLLMMRPEGNFLSDSKLKVEALKLAGLSPREVLACFDDRDSVVTGLRNAGYRVLQVQQGTY